MHFAEDVVGEPLFIREYHEGVIKTNTQEFNQPIVLFHNQALEHILPVSINELCESHIAALTELKPELVLFGTGIKQQFPHPSLFAPLHKKRIGFEVMSTDAACRTFNLLLSEGRGVLAALFV